MSFVACGECFALRNLPKEAMVQLNKARFARPWALPHDGIEPDAERNLVQIDIALTLIDLAGTPKEVLDETRLEWSDIATELQRTLNMITSAEAKQTAMRDVATKLIAKGQADIAVQLAKLMVPPPPAAVEGFPAITDPIPIAKDLQPPDGEPQKALRWKRRKSRRPRRSPLEAPYLALLIGTGSAEPRPRRSRRLLRARKRPSTPWCRLAYAEGHARQGNFELARKVAILKGPPLYRLESSIAVASLALSQNKIAEAKLSTRMPSTPTKNSSSFRRPPGW